MTAESEGRGQSHGQFRLAGAVGIHVQVALRIRHLIMDCGRHYAVVKGHDSSNCLDTSGCSKGMSGPGLGGAENSAAGLRITEGKLDCRCLGLVVQRGTGTVRIDVQQIGGRVMGLGQGLPESLGGSRAVRAGRGIMVSVTCVAVAA